MDFFLTSLSLFKRLPEKALKELSQKVFLRRFGKGQAVFMDGDPPHSVYLLKSGLIKAVKYSRREEPVIMEIISPKGLFGMIALLDQKPYPVTALCICDSELYEIPAKVFENLLKTHPDFSQAVYSEIGEHLRQSQALRAIAREPAPQRIAFILGLLSKSVGKDLAITREDISEMSGTTEETAIRVLSDFRKKKLIISGWKKITVLNPEKLEKYASSLSKEN